MKKQTSRNDHQSVIAEPMTLRARLRRLRDQWPNLNPISRGWGIRDIMSAYPDADTGTLSEGLNVTGQTVRNHRKLTLLPGSLQDKIEIGDMTYNDGLALIVDLQIRDIPSVVQEEVAHEEIEEVDEEAEVEDKDALRLDFDGAYQAYKDWIGHYGAPVAAKQRKPQDIRKTIIINDLHIPFLCQDSLKQMIDLEAKNTDQLVLAGDVATMLNFSAFPKFSRHYTPAEGFFEVSKVLQYLNEIFPEIVIFSGNHDNRFIKWIVRDRGIPPEIIEYFELLAPNFTDPLKIICKELENITVLDPIQYEEAKFAFFYQFGDFVAGHAETYSKIPNRAACNFAHWLKSFAEPCGLVGPESPAANKIRCVGQAHTHQAGKVFGDGAIWMYELGCMCKMEEYTGDPHIRTPRPWVKGYTRVLQERKTGRTLINESNFVHTGRF